MTLLVPALPGQQGGTVKKSGGASCHLAPQTQSAGCWTRDMNVRDVHDFNSCVFKLFETQQVALKSFEGQAESFKDIFRFEHLESSQLNVQGFFKSCLTLFYSFLLLLFSWFWDSTSSKPDSWILWGSCEECNVIIWIWMLHYIFTVRSLSYPWPNLNPDMELRLPVMIWRLPNLCSCAIQHAWLYSSLNPPTQYAAL